MLVVGDDALEQLVVLEVERLHIWQLRLREARATPPVFDELTPHSVEQLAPAPVVQVVLVHLALDALVHGIVHERRKLQLRRAHVRRTDAQAHRL